MLQHPCFISHERAFRQGVYQKLKTPKPVFNGSKIEFVDGKLEGLKLCVSGRYKGIK